uniref:Uncharacterized protein n=1 Tax=Physcomitrium patens TaxID=3218 RepID=A0A2K1L9Y5_PHYPA|nr:hypothetical protein PHYPA_001260 [Physcomitrium patens]
MWKQNISYWVMNVQCHSREAEWCTSQVFHDVSPGSTETDLVPNSSLDHRAGCTSDAGTAVLAFTALGNLRAYTIPSLQLSGGKDVTSRESRNGITRSQKSKDRQRFGEGMGGQTGSFFIHVAYGGLCVCLCADPFCYVEQVWLNDSKRGFDSWVPAS